MSLTWSGCLLMRRTAKPIRMLLELGGYRADKRRRTPKVHLAVDAHGMPLRTLVTEATRADCCLAPKLIESIPAQNLIDDKGYDSNALIEQA